MKTKDRRSQLTFDFDSAYLPHVKKLECFFCDAEFPILPVVVGMTGILDDDGILNTLPMCPACILSDTKALIGKARTTAAEHQHRADQIERKPKGKRTKEEKEFLDIGNNWSDLIDYANRLEHLGDISLIPYYALAVAIANQHTGKRPRKAA